MSYQNGRRLTLEPDGLVRHAACEVQQSARHAARGSTRSLAVLE
jgi:hypothetical protein